MKNFFACLLLSLTLLFSCKKEADTASAAGTLMRHPWHPYQIHKLVYDSSSYSAWSLSQDTTYIVDPCSLNAQYQFLPKNVFVINSACLNPQNTKGSWSLTPDSFLKAAISFIYLGQTYYFGINSRIAAIHEDYFTTKDSLVFVGFSNGSPEKTSIVTLETFKN